MKTRDGGSPVRTVLLAFLVIAAAVAAIVMIERKKTADADAKIKQEEAQPLDATPLMIKGNITKASWRDKDGFEAAEEEKEQEDEFDWDATKAFNGDAAKRERFEGSLETTMKPIQGLGVFVSKSASDDEEEKDK